jgi:hypothetical protein
VVVEEDDPVIRIVRKMDEGKVFGAECLSMHEKVAKYLFY